MYNSTHNFNLKKKKKSCVTAFFPYKFMFLSSSIVYGWCMLLIDW